MMDKEYSCEYGKICVPGMKLCELNEKNVSGPGTYDLGGTIFASLAGVLKLEKDESTQVTTVSVESFKTPSILPKSGDIVTARVTVVNPRMVQCQILCVGPSVLARQYKGILKKEDIRVIDRDRIDPYKCFRPAENELGVVIATAEGSPQGISMVPISWSEMQCPKTLVKEPRKVARVVPDKVNLDLLNSTIKASENNK
ncbi:unnamed protein product [Leptidea sinapis]|uniref:Exosome complex component N-terminal domain-containing protein n=1 Tax=Leptidea sinapis TaxID=189913 RepID=A0A5E4QSY8_9NEOP|nr:unnamed protein product [Leptidea sinapis]